MNSISNDTFSASLRGLLCAGVAMAITASFSWTFTSSTTSLNWMGSSALQTDLVAMTATAGRTKAA